MCARVCECVCVGGVLSHQRAQRQPRGQTVSFPGFLLRRWPALAVGVFLSAKGLDQTAAGPVDSNPAHVFKFLLKKKGILEKHLLSS